MTTTTKTASIDTVQERLAQEHIEWLKAKRSGDKSRQLNEARARMNTLLDEMLLLRLEDTII